MRAAYYIIERRECTRVWIVVIVTIIITIIIRMVITLSIHRAITYDPALSIFAILAIVFVQFRMT